MERKIRFIDDHTGREASFMSPVIGVWRNQRNGRVGLALKGLHCINALYIAKDGNLHLSQWSIGPTATKEEIEKGEMDSTIGQWVLEKMPLEEIYAVVKEAGQTSPVF